MSSEQTIKPKNRVNVNLIKAILTLLDENGKSIESYSLEKNSETTIGRDKSNDITFNDMSVSTNHCVIKIDDKDVYIKDESRYGTFVEGDNLNKKAKRLLDGDKIRISNFNFKIRIIE